jgi:hypothetical protein
MNPITKGALGAQVEQFLKTPENFAAFKLAGRTILFPVKGETPVDHLNKFLVKMSESLGDNFAEKDLLSNYFKKKIDKTIVTGAKNPEDNRPDGTLVKVATKLRQFMQPKVTNEAEVEDEPAPVQPEAPKVNPNPVRVAAPKAQQTAADLEKELNELLENGTGTEDQINDLTARIAAQHAKEAQPKVVKTTGKSVQELRQAMENELNKADIDMQKVQDLQAEITALEKKDAELARTLNNQLNPDVNTDEAFALRLQAELNGEPIPTDERIQGVAPKAIAQTETEAKEPKKCCISRCFSAIADCIASIFKKIFCCFFSEKKEEKKAEEVKPATEPLANAGEIADDYDL